MEMFPAADAAQWDLIERSIEDSDYFVVIVAQRYGSIDDAEGISYTEKEWTHASRTGKPILAFLQDLSAEEMADLEPRLREFRRRLEANRHVKHWREAHDLPGHITAAIAPAIHSSQRAEGWVRGGYSVTEHISVLRGAVTTALTSTERSSADIARIEALIQSMSDHLSSLLNLVTSERPATRAMADYMHVQQLKLRLTQQNAMFGRVADGLLKDPLKTLANLANGSASVPDYQIGHANNLLISSLRSRFDGVSYDDLPFWQSQSRVDVRYRRAIYDAIKRTPDPIVATRIFVFPSHALKDQNRADGVAAVLREQMEQGLAWAIAIEEDVKEDLEPEAALDFALFDGDRAVSYFRKHRKFDVTFHTDGFKDNDGEIERQARTYKILLANCWAASLQFTSSHLFVDETDSIAARATARARSLEHIGFPHARRLFPIIVEDATQVRNSLSEILDLRLRASERA
jgi:hypothetical protein